ncbi:MAG TPA: ATP-binding protein [Chloroflexia bacterium]|nr:ATP-binding protein [Chloroflexia bacterium]
MRQTRSKPGLVKRLSRLLNSVRFRLSLWYVVILAVVLLIFGTIVYSVEATALSAEIDSSLKFVADQAPLVVQSNQGRLELPEQLSSLLQALAEKKLPPNFLSQVQATSASQLLATPLIRPLLDGKFIFALINPQGQLTQSFSPLSSSEMTALVKTASTTKSGRYEVLSYGSGSDSQDYRVYISPMSKNGQQIGTLILGLQWEGAATLRGLLLTLLLAGPAILLLAAGGGYWLANRAMRPVSDITRTAQEISETDLSRRLNIKRRDEIGELAGTFDRMLSRLQAAFDRQRQFTADASHELRTPLTIVNLEVNRALARPRQPHEYEQALGVIQVENEYMSRLVNDLLLLARADAGQAVLNPEKLDLSDLALEVVERLAPLARQQNLSLTTGELPELEVKGDQLYLTRMLTNLVENAIKYTSGTGNSVRVETGSSHDANQGEWAWVRVSDNGPGISPEHLPHLFDRFYQVDQSRSNGEKDESETALSGEQTRGSGLGLAIVQWIAEAHGGQVKVQSQPGQGTTFEVHLPSVT